MDKQKQGSGVGRNGAKRSASDKKESASEMPQAEMDMDVLARGLDHVLQKQLDDKLKNGFPADKEASLATEAAANHDALQQDEKPVEMAPLVLGAEGLAVEQAASQVAEDAGYLASLSVLASVAEEVEVRGGWPTGSESVAMTDSAESSAGDVVPTESALEAVVASEQVGEVASEVEWVAETEQKVEVNEAAVAVVEQIAAEVTVTEASGLSEEVASALEVEHTQEPILDVTSAESAELAVVAEVTGADDTVAPVETMAAVEAVSSAVVEPLSVSAVAERKLEMAKLADGFSEMARNKARVADTEGAEVADAEITAEADVSVTESAVEASLHGTVVVSEGEEVVAKHLPQKAPYVAAAEKERVLQLIRDAASKKLDEGFKMRGVQVMAKSEPVSTEPVTEPPVNADVEASAVVAATDEVVGVAEAAESMVHATVPQTVAEEVPAVELQTVSTEPQDEQAVVATVEESEAADPVVTPSELTSARGEEVEAVLSVPPGGLVPPAPRTATPSLRQKQENVPSPTQAKAIEAFLRQLQGESPLPEEPSVAASAAAPSAAMPDAEHQDEGISAQEATEADRGGSRRRSSQSGDGQVAVESLGTGIYNALGDMVGAVVHSSKRVTSKVKRVVPVPAPEPEEQLPPPRPTGTSRAADRLAGGVRGVAGGVTDIVKGSGNMVIGTVGIVVMPVVGAVSELFRAFKPTRKDSSAEK
ncbi:MAG: hypothetical protein HQM04_13450 [Magnetococcales bacterium]|nr:hypothetical protein [Magnetococcales bacterium]MBF0116031.1 hypothetical protein [Magnetococcales bacterium]